MRVAVLDTKGVMYEGNASEVILPGEDGEFSVLDFHHDFLYKLRSGLVRIVERKAALRGKGKLSFSEKNLKISHGLVTMKSNELVILAET